MAALPTRECGCLAEFDPESETAAFGSMDFVRPASIVAESCQAIEKVAAPGDPAFAMVYFVHAVRCPS